MAGALSALHIVGGDASSAQRIDRWLGDNGVAVERCGDVYRACVRLLRGPALVPELVVIGIDWLSPAQREICGYVRETWPASVQLRYGHEAAPQRPDALPLSYYCRVPDGLATLVAARPDQWIAAIRSRAALTFPDFADGIADRMRAGGIEREWIAATSARESAPPARAPDALDALPGRGRAGA